MRSITITTEEKLKQAIQEKYDEIIVKGDLAKKVKQAEKIKKLSPAAIGVLGGCCAAAVAGAVAAPLTGGASLSVSAVALAPAVAATGLSLPVLIVIALVGLLLMSRLFDEYSEYDDEIEAQAGEFRICFRRTKHD